MRPVAEALQAASRLAVVGHVGPDGDALGSMIGLARAARAAGKEAYATFGEPFVVPHQLAFLADPALVSVSAVPRPLDVLVVVDCGDIGRLGTAAELVDHAGRVVVIDHHRSNGGFGDVAWIVTDAGATAELVHLLIAELGWPAGRDVAEALYTGLVTDTGRFQYSSTSARVHRIAAEMLEAGVAPELIGRKVYEESPFGYLAVAGAVLGRAQLDEEAGLVWSTLLLADLEAAGIRYEDADGLIDLIRVAEEADVACLVREIGSGRVKVSLRSRGGTDVAEIAVGFGGGGHHNAAGFTAAGTPQTVADQVRRALQ